MSDNSRNPEKKRRSGVGASSLATLAFGQFRAGLHRYLLRRLGSMQHVEDLAQEVYLRLLRAPDARTVRHPQAYLYRVAFNVLCEFRFHRKNSCVSFDSDAADDAVDRLSDDSASTEELYDQHKRERLLTEIVAQLPPMQRAVFLLAKHQDLSHADIAAKLGISVNTARVHLHRALCQCRRQIAQDAEQP